MSEALNSSVLQFKPRNLKYVVISSLNSDDKSIEVMSQVYDSWTQIWQKVFSNETRNFNLDPDDFFRQNLVVGLFQNDVLVAFHLYSFFDLRFKSITQHSYFKGIDPISFDNLRSQKLHRVMSMEYLTVMPEFRKNGSQIPWGEIIISLGLNVLKTLNCDIAFGTARRDVKVNKMGDRIGFDILQSPIQKYDYDCEVMYFAQKKQLHHPDPKVQSLIEELWATRLDLRNTEQNININTNKAEVA